MISHTSNSFKNINFLLFIIFSLLCLGCGSFSSSGYVSSDGIYGTKNSVKSNNNRSYYKNYFEQKADEYGLNTNSNDSIITDTSSYTSKANNTNLSYNNSYGSWGDNPSSINIIYQNNSYYDSFWGNYYQPYYMGSWYNNYYYNPFYSWGYPYEMYRGYGYWDYMYRPWGYGGYWGYNNYWRYGSFNNNFYQRLNSNNIAYMNGRRGSNSNSSSSISLAKSSSNISSNSSRSITNYNVGRNEPKGLNDEVIKNRNINRIYYNLKNSTLNSSVPSRNYQNPGNVSAANNGKSSISNESRPYTRPSKRPSDGKSPNFQLSTYKNSSRSYNNSRSNTINNSSQSSTSNRSYNISRSNNSSYSSSSSSSRSSYSPPSTSNSRSSISRSSSSKSSGSSRGPR